MTCLFLLPILMTTGPSATVRGEYVEARTCDVFAGSCFANAGTGSTGKNAVLAWKVDSGSIAGTKVDGLRVLAVLSANETPGPKPSAPARAIFTVAERAINTARQA